jgi:hypothetical protein
VPTLPLNFLLFLRTLRLLFIRTFDVKRWPGLRARGRGGGITFNRPHLMSTDIEALVSRKSALTKKLVECDTKIEEMADAALDRLITEPPFTADEALRVARMVNYASNLQMGDSLEEFLYVFPAPELAKIYDLLKNDTDFYQAVQSDLIPDVGTLLEMNEEQHAVVAAKVSRRDLKHIRGRTGRAKATSQKILEEILEHGKREKALQKERIAKRVKFA